MIERLAKADLISRYLKNNRDEIAKKLRKNRYEKIEEQYNFEEKIRSIIPCNATNALLGAVVLINLNPLWRHALTPETKVS